MAAPSPEALFPEARVERLVRYGAAGNQDALREDLEETKVAGELREELALALGLAILDLSKTEVVGASFGMTRYQRALKTARIIRNNATSQAGRILADRRRVLQDPRVNFQIGGVSSRVEFRRKYLAAKKAGDLRAARKLLDAEILHASTAAAVENIGRRSKRYADRFLDTEYFSAKEHKREKRILAAGFAWEIVEPQSGFCSICAPHVNKPAPAGTIPTPLYHPNCRCRKYPWDPVRGIIRNF